MTITNDEMIVYTAKHFYEMFHTMEIEETKGKHKRFAKEWDELTDEQKDVFKQIAAVALTK